MKRVAGILLLSIIGTMGFTGDMQLFNAGKKAFSVGLYKIAIENFQSFLNDSYNDPNSDDAIYLTAVSQFYLKDYTNSISYLEGIIRDYPSSPYIKNSYYWLGLNKFYLNDLNGAISELEISMEESSYKEISGLYSSLAYTQLGDRDKAKEILDMLVDKRESPQGYREEALYRLAILHLEDNNNNRAIISLNTLILDYPDSKYYIEALNLLGETYFLIGEWSSAERVYLLLLEDKPDSTIYTRLASISWELNDPSEAVSWLSKYKEEYGFNHQVEYMLSDIYLKTSRYDLAKRSLLELYRSGNKDIKRDEVAYKLGVLYYKESNFKESFKYFSNLNNLESNYYSVITGIDSRNSVRKYIMSLNSKHREDKLTLDANNRYINYLKSSGSNELEDVLVYLTDIYPENISYALTLGEFYLENSNWDRSIEYLSKGYKRNSTYYSEISYKLGWIYYNKGEYDRAINYFNKPVLGDAEFSKAQYSKGIALYKLGRIQEGEKTFKSLLSNSGGYVNEVSYYLGLIEKDRNNYVDAISYFYKSSEASELKIDSLSNIGWCYYLQRDFENAYLTYIKLLEIEDDPVYKLNIGNSLFYLKKYEDALERYIEIYPIEEHQESANYKVIEILFKLERDDEALKWVEDSKIDSFNHLLTIGGDFLNTAEYDRALKVFEYISNKSVGDVNLKARTSIGTLYFNREEYSKGFDTFIDLISSSNKEFITDEFISNLSDIKDPLLIEELLVKVKSQGDKEAFIPVYIDIFNQLAYSNENLEIVEELLGLTRKTEEFFRLSYIKANYLYSNGELNEAKSILKAILESENTENEIKSQSIIILGDILNRENLSEEAASLYLNLYLNYPKSQYAPEALYRSYTILVNFDKEQAEKVKGILNSEYPKSIWKKKLNEK